MRGGTDASELFGLNPNAHKFVDDLATRNTAYGPRIISQMPALVEEIKMRPTTRRAVLTILNSEDQSLLSEKRLGTGMEYPCTISLTFFLRQGKLHLHAGMRSNNMTTTVCYDFYNFIHLQKYLLSKLQKEMDVEIGNYYHACASAHILRNEIDFARKILDAY